MNEKCFNFIEETKKWMYVCKCNKFISTTQIGIMKKRFLFNLMLISGSDAASILKFLRIDVCICLSSKKQYRCTGAIPRYPYTDACNPIQVFTVHVYKCTK